MQLLITRVSQETTRSAPDKHKTHKKPLKGQMTEQQKGAGKQTTQESTRVLIFRLEACVCVCVCVCVGPALTGPALKVQL